MIHIRPLISTFASIFCLLIGYSLLQVALTDDPMIASNDQDRVKRHLNWATNFIKSSRPQSAPDIRITTYMPHERNSAVDPNKNYLSFALYKKNSNVGTFHFVDDITANGYRTNCKAPTMHAGAYYYFYSKCPEQETGIIASGYCYQHQRKDLVFNSGTFNVKGMPYLDDHYYLNTEREVNNIEKGFLRECYNNWRNAGFPRTKWNCQITVAQMKRLKREAKSADTDEINCSCDQIMTCGTGNIFLSIPLGMMSILLSYIFV